MKLMRRKLRDVGYAVFLTAFIINCGEGYAQSRISLGESIERELRLSNFIKHSTSSPCKEQFDIFQSMHDRCIRQSRIGDTLRCMDFVLLEIQMGSDCRIYPKSISRLRGFIAMTLGAHPSSPAAKSNSEIPWCPGFGPNQAPPGASTNRSREGCEEGEKDCPQCSGYRNTPCLPYKKECRGEVVFEAKYWVKQCRFKGGHRFTNDRDNLKSCSIADQSGSPLRVRASFPCEFDDSGKCRFIPDAGRPEIRLWASEDRDCSVCKTDEKPGGIATYTCFDPNRKLVEPRSIQEVKNTCSDAGHHGYQVDTSDCEYDPATGGCLGYCTYNTLDKDNGCERGDLEIGVCHETAP